MSGVEATKVEQILQECRDVFAWTTVDISGIALEVMLYRLNFDPTFHSVRRKKRKMAPKRVTVVLEETKKLIK